MERFWVAYQENINFSHELCIWDTSIVIQGGISWFSLISFIPSLFHVYDLNTLIPRIDAFIPICGMCLFQAEKADGFVNLPDFTVERASECKKKQ